MAQKVIIQNPSNGLTKNGYFGFSWTYLFFGWLVPLIRGELGIAALHILFTFLTLGLFQIVMAFFYNKQFMIRMLEKGYVLKDSPQVMAMAKSSIGLADVGDFNNRTVPEHEASTTGINVNNSTSKMKKVFLVIGLFFATLLLIGIGNYVYKNGNKSTLISKDTIESEKSIYVGDSFTTDNLQISITSAEAMSSIRSPLDTKIPAEGAIYIAIQSKYENISKKPLSSFENPTIHLIDPNGNKYDPDISATIIYASALNTNTNTKTFSDLNPGISVNDGDVFEVSKKLFDMKTWKIRVEADDNFDVKFIRDAISKNASVEISNQKQKAVEPVEEVKNNKTTVSNSSLIDTVQVTKTTQNEAVIIPEKFQGSFSSAKICKDASDPESDEESLTVSPTYLLWNEYRCDLASVKLNEPDTFIGSFRCSEGDDGEMSSNLKDKKIQISNQNILIDTVPYAKCNYIR